MHVSKTDHQRVGGDGPHSGWVQGVDNQVAMCVCMVTNGTGGGYQRAG